MIGRPVSRPFTQSFEQLGMAFVAFDDAQPQIFHVLALGLGGTYAGLLGALSPVLAIG